MSSMTPSSPRLPSPPPAAEIQVTPNSPSGGPAATLQATELEQSVIDAHSKRRIHPGTKASEMAAGPPVVPLNELESAFSLQEHLAALHYHHTEQGTGPIDRTTALQLAQPPSGVDRTLWLYELCRFLISKCNSIIVGFLFDSPPCSAATCPEMRASEWQFLCAVHEQPKSCCAIDYCCHTLDWAANVVSDQKIFPSRFVVISDPQSRNVGLKNLINVFRRLHRIFAHAWFQHRAVFWSVESETGLYVFFKLVCDLYELLPAENYKLPPEAEGLEPEEEEEEQEVIAAPPTILKPQSSEQSAQADDSSPVDDAHLSTDRTNTRRHIRSSPSTGSAVTTVIEADEEETDNLAKDMDDLSLSNMASSPEPMKGSFQTDEARPTTPHGRSLDEIFDSKHDEPELFPPAQSSGDGKQKEGTPEEKRKGTKTTGESSGAAEKAGNKAEEPVIDGVNKEASQESVIKVTNTDKTENGKKSSEESVIKDESAETVAEKTKTEKPAKVEKAEKKKNKSEKTAKGEEAEKSEKAGEATEAKPEDSTAESSPEEATEKNDDKE